MAKREDTKSVYVLAGEDTFLQDSYRKEIVSRAIGDADPQTCISNFDADAELASVLDELRTLPFLAPHRVVIIRSADAFISKNRETLEEFLESPPTTATLILQANNWKKNTRLHKLIAKIGEIVDCDSPSRGLDKWIAKSAKKRGKQIAPDAAALLLECIGNDLALLTNELDKLSLYVGDRENITAQDVSEIVTATAGPAPFALDNALVAGDAAGALKALDGMLTARGMEFMVLRRIGTHLRKALKAQQAAEAGEPPESTLNPRMPYRAKNAFIAMLRRKSRRKLEQDFRRLIRVDMGMKRGLDATSALQELIIDICR